MFSVAGEALSTLMAGLVGPRIPTQRSHSAGTLLINACRHDPVLGGHMHMFTIELLAVLEDKLSANYMPVINDVNSCMSIEDPLAKCAAIFAVLEDKHIGNSVLYKTKADSLTTKFAAWFGGTPVEAGLIHVKVDELQEVLKTVEMLQIPVTEEKLKNATIEFMGTSM